MANPVYFDLKELKSKVKSVTALSKP